MHSCTMKKNVLQYLNLLMLTTCFKVERFDSGDVLKSINKETCRLISNSIWVSNRCKCPPNSSTYSDVYGTHACYKATDLCSGKLFDQLIAGMYLVLWHIQGFKTSLRLY